MGVSRKLGELGFIGVCILALRTGGIYHREKKSFSSLGKIEENDG